jgi:hypothetical protein
MNLTIQRLTDDLLYFTSTRDYAAAISTIDQLKTAIEVGEADQIPDLE